MSEQIFGVVLDKAKAFLEERGIEIVSEETMMKALPLIIECVEAVKEETMTGEEKSDLALRVLLFVVNEAKIDDAKKDLMRELIEGGTLKTTISIIVDASKGKLELNRRTKRKLLEIAKEWLEIIITKGGCCVTAPDVDDEGEGAEGEGAEGEEAKGEGAEGEAEVEVKKPRVMKSQMV